ncbi:MAG: hypothetical protein LBU15_01810 [Rickettsiales bacterium]|nr:hypothetical protein [Rickettsiales bacterium]
MDENTNWLDLPSEGAGPRITEFSSEEEEEAGRQDYSSETWIATEEPGGVVVKRRGNFDSAGHLVSGQKAVTGPDGGKLESKFETGTFDPSDESLTSGNRTGIAEDGMEFNENGKFIVSGYIYSGEKITTGGAGKTTETFDFDPTTYNAADHGIGGSKIIKKPNGTKITEDGTFDLRRGSIVSGKVITLKNDKTTIKEEGEFSFDVATGKNNLVKGTRITDLRNGKRTVEKVGTAERGSNPGRVLTKFRNFLRKARELVQKLATALSRLFSRRLEGATREFDHALGAENQRIR